MNALIKDGMLTDEFAAVLAEIFRRFDRDRDGVLNRAELGQFYKATNGKAITNDVVNFFRSNFLWKRNGLTAEGFVYFYFSQTAEDPSETINDLKQLGYNPAALAPLEK